MNKCGSQNIVNKLKKYAPSALVDALLMTLNIDKN